MKNATQLLLLLFCTSVLFAQNPQLPIDFESSDLTYNFSDFAGGVATVIDNPQMSGINTSDRVAQMIKFKGETFGGSTLALEGAIDFGDNTVIAMKTFANRVGAPVLVKLEGTAPVEVSMMTTVANEWEELLFDFSGLTGGSYTAITIIYDLGVVGDGGPDFTLLFDDMRLTDSDGIDRPTLPISFESEEITYQFNDFAGGVATIIDNPEMSGINTSGRVVQLVKFEGDVFGGSTLILEGAIDFEDNTVITMKTFANRVGAPVLFKLEGPAPVERSMNTTVANEWEELMFDFSGDTGGAYTGITIIYDLGVVGDGGPDFTLLFDDIQFPGTSAVVDFSELEIKLYPNPTVDVLNIVAEETIESVTVYDMSGRQLLTSLPFGTVSNINVAALQPGNYLVRISISGQEAVSKFVKK